MTASVSFEQHHRDFLRDPERARAYLEVALEVYSEDRNSLALMLALRDIANARLVTMEKILHGLGYRLSIEPLAPRNRES